jgi:malate dehydrogenase (oxaloacetate-decarboxylating)(NADP+)
MDESLKKSALDYHRIPTPGKISVNPTKALITQRDLALAYSPGVAFACNEIVADAGNARAYTSRGNLIGVVTNGTAVLGLGPIGPLAAKPVMEGKAVLFKKFAGIDCFDIEINERDPDKLVDMIAALEPTFGGINLEDIKAPECFYIERQLRRRMKIPVFHDDQHGTAIIVGAALLNGLKVVEKDIGKVKLVVSGAGAAALACLDLLVQLGVDKRNIVVTDIAGVVYAGRKEEMDDNKIRYAIDTKARTLAEVIPGADVFLGWCAEAGDGEVDGTAPDHPGARQSDAGDHAGRREVGAAGCGYRHRPFGFPEPGEQRAVLPVHLPRCTGRGCHHDHGRDEARGGPRDRRSGDG